MCAKGDNEADTSADKKATKRGGKKTIIFGRVDKEIVETSFVSWSGNKQTGYRCDYTDQSALMRVQI